METTETRAESGYPGFSVRHLDEDCLFYSGQLPPDLALNDAEFSQLWELHPEEYHEIHMHGRLVKTPRWQQAYGKNYRYTGAKNNALPIPEILEVFLKWSQKEID